MLLFVYATTFNPMSTIPRPPYILTTVRLLLTGKKQIGKGSLPSERSANLLFAKIVEYHHTNRSIQSLSHEQGLESCNSLGKGPISYELHATHKSSFFGKPIRGRCLPFDSWKLCPGTYQVRLQSRLERPHSG